MAQTFSVYPATPVQFESVSAVTVTPSVTPGTVRTWNGEDYVYVCAAGATLSQGKIAVLSHNSGYTVTVCSTTGYDAVFGVCKHADIAAGSHGWLLTRGFCTLINGMASTALAVGALLVPAVDGKVAVKLDSTSATGVPFGYVVSACASGGTGNSQCLAFVRGWGS